MIAMFSSANTVFRGPNQKPLNRLTGCGTPVTVFGGSCLRAFVPWLHIRPWNTHRFCGFLVLPFAAGTPHTILRKAGQSRVNQRKKCGLLLGNVIL